MFFEKMKNFTFSRIILDFAGCCTETRFSNVEVGFIRYLYIKNLSQHLYEERIGHH